MTGICWDDRLTNPRGVLFLDDRPTNPCGALFLKSLQWWIFVQPPSHLIFISCNVLFQIFNLFKPEEHYEITKHLCINQARLLKAQHHLGTCTVPKQSLFWSLQSHRAGQVGDQSQYLHTDQPSAINTVLCQFLTGCKYTYNSLCKYRLKHT